MTDRATPESVIGIYNVPGMSCQHCIDSITKEVGGVDGVTELNIDLDAKTVTVSGGEDAAIVEAIDEAGFDVA
jgi:copper chaperone